MTTRATLLAALLAALLVVATAALLTDATEARGTADTTAPNTRVSRHPGSPTNRTDAAFAFRSAGAAFGCSLDGAAFRPCASPAVYRGLDEGRHGFRVRGIGAAGDADPTPASVSWKVDLTAPKTLLTATETGVAPAGDAARFEFSADEPVGGFYCSLDGGPPARCASPRGYAGLPAGRHTFTVQARDEAGNPDPTPEEAAWTVAGAVAEDRAPAVAIEGAPRIEGYHEYHHFEFSADVPGSDFYCALDDGPFAPCASGAYRYVPYGRHTFAVYAVGPGGERGEAAVTEYESRDPNWD